MFHSTMKSKTVNKTTRSAARFDDFSSAWWRAETFIKYSNSIDPVCNDSFLKVFQTFVWIAIPEEEAVK